MRKTMISLLAVLVLAGLAVFEYWGTSVTVALPTEEAPKVGYLAPSFQLETLEGGNLGIAPGKRDKPVILNFWASWCEPCRLEAPLLADLHAVYGGRIDFYGINGTEYDRMDSVQAFLQQYDIKYATLLDKKSEVFKKYEVPGYPTSVFIDANGVIQDIVIGLPGHEEFERRVKKLARG